MSISPDLPTIDVSQSLQTRSQTRTTRWEADFENNHTAFAEAIALRLLQSTLVKFDKHLKDPYRKGFDVDSKHLTSLSLDITKSGRLKAIAGPAADASPFNEWIEKFTIHQDPSPYVRRKKLKEIDESYFQELMALVGKKAANKIRVLLTDYVSKPEHADLRFHVEWYRQAEKLLSNPSNFTDNCINIQLWLAPQTEIPSAAVLPSSRAIIQHRIEAAAIKRKQTRNNVLMLAALGVAIMILMRFSHLYKMAQEEKFD
jgi:hypothetical protein